MISLINNSQPANQNITRLAKSGVIRHSLRCNQKPFCATSSRTSFISIDNKIYSDNNQLAVSKNTNKINYPGWGSFGRENTKQNIYSADPQKLRIGIF